MNILKRILAKLKPAKKPTVVKRPPWKPEPKAQDAGCISPGQKQ